MVGNWLLVWPLWPRVKHSAQSILSPWLLLAGSIQFYSAMMVKLWLADQILIDTIQHSDIKSRKLVHSAFRASGTHRVLLQSDGLSVACEMNDYEQCNTPKSTCAARLGGSSHKSFTYTQVSAGWGHTLRYVVMAALWLAEATFLGNAAFQLWRRDCHTPRFLQGTVIQCFCEAMEMLWLVGEIDMDSATFHNWMPERHTQRFLHARFILCSSGVMAALLHSGFP